MPAKRGDMPGCWIKVYADEIRFVNQLSGENNDAEKDGSNDG